MSHIDFNQKSQSKGIHVHEPLSKEEFENLIEFFQMLLIIQQKNSANAVGDSNQRTTGVINDGIVK